MDRKDFYYLQEVTQEELDAAFDYVEQGEMNSRVEGLTPGVLSGLAPTLGGASDNEVTITKGVAYDKNGRRVPAYSDAAEDKTFTLDLATDGTSLPVTSGQERWVSIFAKHGRKLSDERVDGNEDPIFFDQKDALKSTSDDDNLDKFLIVAGASAGSGSGVKPDLLSDAVLVCDVKLTFNNAANVLDVSRRETAGIPADRAPGTNGLALIMSALTSWLGGRTNPAQATLHAQIDKIITDLAATAASDDGAERIGAQANGGLSVGSVRSQLDELDTLKAALAGTNTWPNKQTFSTTVALSPTATVPGVETAAVAADRVLLWETNFPAETAPFNRKIRIYANNAPLITDGPSRSLLITFNARWSAGNWFADETGASEEGSMRIVELCPGIMGLADGSAHGVDGTNGFLLHSRMSDGSPTIQRTIDCSQVLDGAGDQIPWNFFDLPLGITKLSLTNGLFQIGMPGQGATRKVRFGTRGYGTETMGAGGTIAWGWVYSGAPSSLTLDKETETNCSATTIASANSEGFRWSTVVTAAGEFEFMGTLTVAL